MGTILTIIFILLAAFVLILLSLGLVVALSVVFVLVLVAGGLSLLFGDGDFIQTTRSVVTTEVDPRIQEIPQAFNACLFSEKLDVCERGVELINKGHKEIQDLMTELGLEL